MLTIAWLICLENVEAKAHARILFACKIMFLIADFLKNRKARFEYFSLDPHHIAARGLA